MKAGQAKVAVNIRFDVETYQKLEVEAHKLSLTVSGLVTQLALKSITTTKKKEA
jgi:hypothetical protein